MTENTITLAEAKANYETAESKVREATKEMEAAKAIYVQLSHLAAHEREARHRAVGAEQARIHTEALKAGARAREQIWQPAVSIQRGSRFDL